jgi:hypothetical protein
MREVPWRRDDKRHALDKLAEIEPTSLPPPTTRPPPAPPPQRRRRPGGGRKRYFSQDRIEELQEACRKILHQKPTLKKRKNIDALVERLRSFLKPEERDVSRDHLLRKIIWPVIKA